MQSEPLTRRDFLKTASAAGAALALGGHVLSADDKPTLPQKELGRTKVQVPILGLGTAPAGHRPDRKEAIAFYHKCIDSGVTYIDTAPKFAGYGNAQEYLGEVLKDRRKETFVVTKCHEPNGEKALELLKKNLKELRIEQADLVYAHSIGDDKMTPDKIFAANGVCQALDKAKRDGLTRFVGVSGHNRPARFLKAMEEWDFDVMMVVVSLVARHVYNFEEKVLPTAAKKNLGIAAMKVFGGGSKKGESRFPANLRPAAFRYALGVPGVNLSVIGMYDEEELKQNLEWLKTYKPLTAEELKELEPKTRELAEKWKAFHGPV